MAKMKTGSAPSGWTESRVSRSVGDHVRGWPIDRLGVVTAVLLLVVAFAARVAVLGDPVVHIDEQFYLLVGGRMLHGALPYVDIWDRKPVGLFLLYEAFRAFGGPGVLTYQIAALISAWLTSLILFALARRVAPAGGAFAAAILYLLWLDIAGGEGGQAPVFYTLPVVAAIAIVFRSRAPAAGADALRWRGAAAMLLFGVAMQIKYSCVFEGLFAGIQLIAIALSRRRARHALAIDMLLWVVCALLPTLLAFCAYLRLGHGSAWWYANVTSILTRGSERPETIAMRIATMAKLVVPLLLCVPLRRWLGCRSADARVRSDLRFLDGWAATALLGVVLFGTWFDHYALPLFAPFAVTAAPLWRRRAGQAWLMLMIVVIAYLGQHALRHHIGVRGDGRVLAAAAAVTRGMRNCLFVYDGYPALYDVTGSCLPTTRIFSSHLQARNEIGATGIDEATEVDRIMAAGPDRVMTMEPAYREENLAARRALYRYLDHGYRTLFRYIGTDRQLVVYGRTGSIPTDLHATAIRAGQ